MARNGPSRPARPTLRRHTPKKQTPPRSSADKEPTEAEWEKVLWEFMLVRCAQSCAAQLRKIAKEWEEAARIHRAAADELEHRRDPKRIARHRLLQNLEGEHGLIAGVLESHYCQRIHVPGEDPPAPTPRERYVASLPAPLGSYVAQLHLAGSSRHLCELQPDALRACAKRFIDAAEHLHAILPDRVAARMRKSGGGDGGRLPDVALDRLVRWAHIRRIGYRKLGSRLAQSRVPLDPKGAPLFKWHEVGVRGAHRVGVACPEITHAVSWDESDPMNPRAVIRLCDANETRLREQFLGRKAAIPLDTQTLRLSWEQRLKTAQRRFRANGRGTEHSAKF